MEYAASRRWAYMGIPYFHKRVFKKNFDFFREACEKGGLHGVARADGLARARLRGRERRGGAA